MVVSSPDQADTYAAQIAARAGIPSNDVRGKIHPFRSLVAALGASADNAGFQPIGRAFQRLILTELLPRTLRHDDFLGRMLEAPRFADALAERIREWKLARLTPDALEQGADAAAERLDDPSFRVKACELARLFHAYETFLMQNRLRDDEDLLRLAAEHVTAYTEPLPNNARFLLVDGFYRFNTAQRLLLAAIAGRGLPFGKPELSVAVTLPYDASRPLLFAAPERTLRILRAEFTTQEETLTPPADVRPPMLSLLEAHLFESQLHREEGRGKREESTKPVQSTLTPSPSSNIGRGEMECSTEREVADLGSPYNLPTPPSLARNERPEKGDGGLGPQLQLFDAPNAYVEAEMVAREFRRLYADGGLCWSDFAVILRTMGDYAPILSAVFERYGIPLGVDGPEILAENPLLKTLLSFCAVVRYGWRRDDVIAFLKSSYTAPDKLVADALRRRARAASVREGRARWLALVQSEDAVEGSVAETLHTMARCEERLDQGRDSPVEFAKRIREVMTEFGLEERIATGDPVRQKRDHAALKLAMEVMDNVATMDSLSGRALVSFAEFHDSLLTAWQSAAAIAPIEGDVVRVAEPYDARERPLKVAAVMGLTERVFPRRVTEDPFLRDDERIALRHVLGADLEEQQSRADDERFFFYLAVTAPSQRLLLSFPRSADESDTLPSFYLDEVRAVFAAAQAGDEAAPPPSSFLLPPYTGVPTISRTLADVAPQPEEVVSDADRLLAACAGLFDPGAESDDGERERRLRQAAALMQECLREEREGEAGAEMRTIVASRHLPRLPRLESADLRADFAGHKPVFSVSELETYRRCPFQYLLRHTLQLRPEEEDANPRTQGTLLHAVLRRYFRRRNTLLDKPSLASDAAALFADLESILTEVLAEADLDASPHRRRMIERMLSESLQGFAAREHRFSAQFGMQPTHFELAFGVEALPAIRLEEDDHDREVLSETEGARIHDPASCAEPLCISARDGGPDVAVCGTIDRVDLDTTGLRVLVLDYKLGSSVDYSAIQRGDSLQMPLYLLAMERLFNKAGAAACYDAMREPGRRRFFRSEHVNLRQFAPITPLEDGTTVKPLNREQFAELIRTAEVATVTTARAIQAGRIEATPGDACSACAFGDVCRTTLAGGHDGEPQPLFALGETT
jgi:ATP-dependent helicase/nuclease subunit B